MRTISTFHLGILWGVLLSLPLWAAIIGWFRLIWSLFAG